MLPLWRVKIFIAALRILTVTGHFGHKILRHQDTLGHFGTDLKTLRHQKRGTRHFDPHLGMFIL